MTRPQHIPKLHYQAAYTSHESPPRFNLFQQASFVRPHWWIDYGSNTDNTIVAAAYSKVRLPVNSGTGFGKYIIITHGNGWETLYAHLSVINVSPRQKVKHGQKIDMKGTTGNSTGVHLHFEISKGKWSNKYVTHINPALHIDDQDVRHSQTTLNQIGTKWRWMVCMVTD